MRRALPLLLPVLALAIVAIAAAVVLGMRDQGNGRPAAVAAVTETPAATPELPSARTSRGSVCEGVVSRPDASAPRTFNAMYTKRRDVGGIAIVGDAKVDDRAFTEAAKTIERVFRHNDLEARLVEEGAYVIIADAKQGVLDLPEFACLQGEVNSDFFNHVCGVSDRADYPVATVNELDLEGEKSGPCGGLNILYHEVGHLVQGWTLDHADYIDVKLFYQAALDAGFYRRQYAATNSNEYFAEGTQSYFLSAEPGGGKDRAWLKKYDPELFELLDRIYRD